MMKTKHFLIGITAVLLMCGGCEKEDLSWKINNLDIFVSKYQGWCAISVERSDLSLIVVPDAAADWCTVRNMYLNSPVDENGLYLVVIEFNIVPNPTTEQRIAHVTVSGHGQSEVVTITQEEGDATILIEDHTMIVLDYTAGAFSVPVTSNGLWTAVVEPAATWCTLTTASGKGDGTITINTQEATFRRYTTITVSVGTSQDSVMLFQHGMPVHDPGVNINGVIWATRNVNDFGSFAMPGEAGKFYQYGRVVAYTSTDPLSPAWNNAYPEDWTWSLINDPCPGGWRVPSIAEYQSLAASGWRWVTADEGGLGTWFGPGAQNASLYPTVPTDAVFFPAAGARILPDGHLLSDSDQMFQWPGENGCYWSTEQWGSNAPPMQLGEDGVDVENAGVHWNKRMALSIRCVKR